jgi:hypothetical protein
LAVRPETSAVTYLFTPNGNYDHIWKNWYPDQIVNGHPTYYGSWGSYYHSPGIVLWIWRVDAYGNPDEVSVPFFGSYQEDRQVLFAVCDSQCSGWW